jgi:thiol-disulfide isomerase/thioredoxin
MTASLIFWIRIAIIAWLAYGLWGIIKNIRKQHRIIPSTSEEWKIFLPDLLFFCLGIFFLFWLEKNFQQQIDIVIKEKNKPLTGLYFTNLETGNIDSLGAYKGKVVILNIWATWCGPCRKELPSLEKLSADYKDDVVVLALSDEQMNLVQDFKQKNNYKLAMGVYAQHPLLDSLQSRPVSILIDKNNLVKDVAVGAREYSFFRKWIAPYIKN